MASLSSRLQSLRVYVLGGLIPAVLGTLLIGFGAYYYLHRRYFLAHAVHTQGTVVGNFVRSRSTGRYKHAPHYAAVFTFADAAGKTWRVTDQSPEYTLAPTPVGQSCPVVYNPDDPADAQLELPDTFWNAVGFAPYAVANGALFAAVGTWVLRRHHARPGPPAAARDPAILSGP